MKARIDALIDAVGLLAMAIWLGGLVVLGAIVAPTVFHNVPAPTSADAMTLVFGRFDRVALVCAALAAVAEAARLARGSRLTPGDDRIAWLRATALGIAVVLAVVEALVLSPEIASLHRAGAIRGLSAAGLRLEEFHGWAERVGKGEVLFLVFALVAHARPGNKRTA